MGPSESDETGEFDLEGLFVLGHAVDSIGARRVVLDTIESLFAGLSNHSTLRAELRRLFRWIKQRELTAIITCERAGGSLTRHGLEEYVRDCVVLLDHRVTDQLSTSRLGDAPHPPATRSAGSCGSRAGGPRPWSSPSPDGVSWPTDAGLVRRDSTSTW